MLESQILLSAIILFIIFRTVIGYKKNHLSKSFAISWLIFWIISLVVILTPDLLIKIAHYFNIGRGVDLIIYFSIIIIFYSLYKIFVKLADINKKITEIIRNEALKNPKANK